MLYALIKLDYLGSLAYADRRKTIYAISYRIHLDVTYILSLFSTQILYIWIKCNAMVNNIYYRQPACQSVLQWCQLYI